MKLLKILLAIILLILLGCSNNSENQDSETLGCEYLDYSLDIGWPIWVKKAPFLCSIKNFQTNDRSCTTKKGQQGKKYILTDKDYSSFDLFFYMPEIDKSCGADKVMCLTNNEVELMKINEFIFPEEGVQICLELTIPLKP